MILLIVLSSLLAYIFIGLVVGKVWEIKSMAKCLDCTGRYGYCDKDHVFPAMAAGFFWPVGPILILTALALHQASGKIANALTKNDKKGRELN